MTPKIDLHRHLDGNIRLSTILELSRSHGIPLPADDLEGLRPFVTITEPAPGLLAFLDKFRYSVGALADLAACRRVAYENVEDALREGLDAVELRFSPWFMAQPHGLDPTAVVGAVAEGVEQGRRDFGVKTRLIGILSRTFGAEIAWKELEALLAFRGELVAIDLAGDEAGFPPGLFKKHFARVRDVGLHVTIHAGEAAGPESIWEAIRVLGAERIGHGIRAVEDPALLDFLVNRRIGLECCITSNVQTSTVPDFASHPLRTLLERGVIATINTDDPGISGIDYDHELTVAAPAAGLTPDQIRRAQENAALIAFS
ncbi:MAG TPA: adenosine deaminase [Terrimicrobiaceae bacterium]|nr:adenosine deaminase [Terrimicrobiaceae bacterium]